MNKQAPCFNLGQIESLSKVISNYITGSEITKMLSHCCISDNSGESTKWRRLESCFIERQNCDQSPTAGCSREATTESMTTSSASMNWAS